MTQMHRRDFLKRTSQVSASAAIGVLAAGKARADANETIRVGVIGVKGRGQSHMAGLEKIPGVEVVALCDVDMEVLKSRQEKHEKLTGRKVAIYQDARKLFDDKSIDAVGIAAPNHWHTLGSIWAIESGKHVYVEKPLSHNVSEGRILTEYARHHKRIVQHGTQIRSSEAVREGIQMLQDGIIGDVYYAKGTCYKRRNTIGKAREEQPPAYVDYNSWLGPAPDRAFTQNRFHYKWHWHWDYGNGDIGNQGVHQMDVARWGLGVGLPSKVQAMGGHFMFDDDQETPNTMLATMEYPGEAEHKKKMLVFEVRHWITNSEGKQGDDISARVGNIFLGSEGMMVIPNYRSYQVYFGPKLEKGPGREAPGSHFGNFIDAIRKNDHTVLNADVEEGHLASALCHLANVSYRLGRTVNFDPQTEDAIDDAEASRALTREYREPFVVKRLDKRTAQRG